jgi:hypothetical protein
MGYLPHRLKGIEHQIEADLLALDMITVDSRKPYGQAKREQLLFLDRLTLHATCNLPHERVHDGETFEDTFSPRARKYWMIFFPSSSTFC